MNTWIAIGLVAAAAAAPPPTKGADKVLARWNGGELTEAKFVEASDPDGKLLTAGGPLLEGQICKAVFRTIYAERARQAGLDASPAFVSELVAWRDGRLEAIYVAGHMPASTELVPDSDVRKAFEVDRERLYTSPGSADLSVLFVRCGDQPETRAACRETMNEYQVRVTLHGDELSAVIDEARSVSGPASGSFANVPLDRLAAELRQAALMTPVGQFAPLIDTPAGLFWMRVEGRVDPAPVPFERVEPHIRQTLIREREAAWRGREAARVRAEFGLPASSSDRQALVAAAVAEGLDRDAVFLAEERTFVEWKLADLAFFEDREILPDDAEIARRIASPESDATLRRFDLEWIHVTVGEDRYVALARLEELKAALARPTDWSAVDDLVQRESDVIRLELDEVVLDDVFWVSPELAKDLPDVADGGWTGPYAFPRGASLSGELLGGDAALDLPPGVGLVVRRSTRLPTVDEARKEIHRWFRDEITSPDRFREAFGARWGLEVLVGGDPVLADPAPGDAVP
jgi:hypothetical protein